VTASDPGVRRRSLTDDLLADLEQGAPRTPTPSTSAERPPAAAPEPTTFAAGAPQTPTVELRITPRSWSAATVAPLPDGGGVAVSLGPLRVSLWRNRG
jgi:hypothetical protein